MQNIQAKHYLHKKEKKYWKIVSESLWKWPQIKQFLQCFVSTEKNISYSIFNVENIFWVSGANSFRYQIRITNSTEFFLQYWTNQIIIFFYFKDSEDESEIPKQSFWKKMSRKFFKDVDKSKKERVKLWSSAQSMYSDDAVSLLQGVFYFNKSFINFHWLLNSTDLPNFS